MSILHICCLKVFLLVSVPAPPPRTGNTQTHRLTQFSIMLLDMSWMRLSRCLANSSSGQCRSLMKVWRASSFQNRSSDVPEPLLPPRHTHTHTHKHKHTHTHTGQMIKVTPLEREGVRRWGRGWRYVVAGAEEDAVPLPLSTVQVHSDHTLTGPLKRGFGRFWPAYGWKGAGRVYCHGSITMLHSMVIDWDVKWPHAGKVTAETAADHTVSRQRREGMETWGRACKKKKKNLLMVRVWFQQKEKNLQITFPSSQALSQRPCPGAGGAPGRFTKQTMQTLFFWGGTLRRCDWGGAAGETLGRGGDTTGGRRVWKLPAEPPRGIVFSPAHAPLSQSHYRQVVKVRDEPTAMCNLQHAKNHQSKCLWTTTQRRYTHLRAGILTCKFSNGGHTVWFLI